LNLESSPLKFRGRRNEVKLNLKPMQALIYLFVLAFWALEVPGAHPLVIYSARKEELIRPLIRAFEEDHSIKVTILTGGAGELARRIELEKGNPRGDLFLGTTAGVTELLRGKGLLASYNSARSALIPAEFRAPDGSWIGITGRVRVVIYNHNLVRSEELPKSFFDLSQGKWRGKIAVASMGERSTVSWIAALMAARGEPFTKKYIESLQENRLRILKDNTEVRRAVASGEYALGITNHYYYLLQLKEDPTSPIGVIYPDQGPLEMGTPVFTITAAIIQGTKNVVPARAFVDYLLTPKGNKILVEEEFEIPLLPGIRHVGSDKGVLGLGQFKRSRVTQVEMAKLEPKVEELFRRAFIP
jgi:iron(III) transport system substrate-binding protein